MSFREAQARRFTFAAILLIGIGALDLFVTYNATYPYFEKGNYFPTWGESRSKYASHWPFHVLISVGLVGGGLYLLWRRRKIDMPFIKMNGAGNDFVILDLRNTLADISVQDMSLIASRANPVTGGCDQIIILDNPKEFKKPASVFMRIINADGSEVSACGNATRCVAKLIMDEAHTDKAVVETKAGLLTAECDKHGAIKVNMGKPRLRHADIPMAEDVDRMHVPLTYSELRDGHAVGMGNPHVVFFVPDVDAVALEAIGPQIEHRTDMFPERVNVSVAQVMGGAAIKVRTWERGAGLTQACGTAACAVTVAAHERGLTGRNVQIQMPGGVLPVEWDKDDNVWLGGPVEETGRGEILL